MLINPGAFGIDSSSNHPSGALLQQHGITFVCGYTSDAVWKNSSAAIIRDLWDHGIGFIPNLEFSGVETGGNLQGRHEAAVAVSQVRAWAQTLNVPIGPWITIVASLDTSNMAGAVEYNRGASEVIRAAGFGFGAYGDGQFIAALHAAGIVLDIIWATNAFAWPGGVAPDAHIRQGVAGPNLAGLGSVDGNVCFRQFEAWSGQTMPLDLTPNIPIIATPVTSSPTEDTMRLVCTTDNLGIWFIAGSSITNVSGPQNDALKKAGVPTNEGNSASWLNAGELAALQALLPGTVASSAPESEPAEPRTFTGQITLTAS